MSELRITTDIDANQRLQQLQAQQAKIQAEIAAISSSLPSSSHQNHRSPIHKHHQRRSVNNVPRSMSSSGATMARQLSDRTKAPPRARTLSQQSAPPMARSNSRGTSSTRSVPFVHTGVTPTPFRPEARQNPTTDWIIDQPLYSYSISNTSPQLELATSQRLKQVPEMDSVMEHPLDYIARTRSTPRLAISPPTNNDCLSTNSFNIATPSTPTTDSLTTATTYMSRQNSLSNEPIYQIGMIGQDSLDEPCKNLEMLRFNSNNSYSSDFVTCDQVTPYYSSYHTRRSSEHQAQLLVGAGGASNDSHFSSLSSEAFASPGFGEKMEKTQSSESTSSTSSTASRNKQRLVHTNIAAARPLMPKGGSDENSMSRENSSQSMTRLESKDGSQDKLAISKPTYQRPKHDRVHCNQCESHTEGFRGEHELRRHQDREHKSLVKKWVCIEPTGHSHPKPELPLSKCKACNQQKKKYGAYYNAAAHLRRAHFKPKAKGRNKSTKIEDNDKRGGKGGGDWPPMSELKHWMKEVEEPATDYNASPAKQQEEIDNESDNEQLDDTTATEQFFTQHNSIPTVVSSNYASHNAYPGNSPLLNLYTNTSNEIYDLQSMQYMPLDLSSSSDQSSSIDTSMYGVSVSQTNFSNFSPTSHFSNDALTFDSQNISNLPILPTQSFDDHAVMASVVGGSVNEYVNFSSF
ncbi:hypothetical protein BGZ60DRAFT_32153 [Tricladium varicosporioides]|nr:hypothetical protein BGZ60DRAFT_32153 [Hymenoscyphus varicosporioides]